MYFNSRGWYCSRDMVLGMEESCTVTAVGSISHRLRHLKEPCHLQPFSMACIFSLRRIRRGQPPLEPREPLQEAESVEGPLEIYEELEVVYESEPLLG